MDAIQALLQQARSLDTIRAQLHQIQAAVSIQGLGRGFSSLDWQIQAVIVVVVLLLVRMVIGIVRSTIRTVWWVAKVTVVVLAAAFTAQYLMTPPSRPVSSK
ncbi:hypothetical protein BCR33DRAFT_712479 [Rhizoclosmatium globosum]|uniref:Uncharacterized protein n=1 Tax=Rhizoclosmatium globosum TaxID=329046 RepID=A0A1Y2CWM8_9FUNG|nr:hypothetical protein BCR33DRAFT_712479 [Rhizoclosmatium globosum]|eukprot:ORY51420.1 hypothetical protein BCR33DRAFT_712479 [Rhizoclosmatium globosum]